MSINGRFPQSPDDIGQSIASFPTYEAAQKAVSTLIAAEVPARDIAIVGQDLRSVERVTGRLGYATAARSGAMNGVLLGLLFSAILVIGTPSVPIQAFVGVLFVGIAIGMLMSLITYSFVRRRRDFASVMQVIAEHYEVTVAAGSVQRARQVLGGQAPPRERPPVAPAAATPPPIPPPAPPQGDAAAEPPRYGERVAPAADDPAEPRASGRPGPDEPTRPEDGAAADEGGADPQPSR
ncbi:MULTISPECIES: general stress protein [unclassified Microbacterium]|uniref:general stress protein n=1 Tax=unclassified Microbacterium TaxID=2609290 RepID=UPI00214AFF15|nr:MULTISPECIES: general stress protein [unclassified Microbacterium]MCR2809775.1 hypothetical protein [Microbacterium sp. zg.B185]WIM17914.1 hypothetical protein QNO12_09810 [Microbacterium sp. zg-B185]